MSEQNTNLSYHHAHRFKMKTQVLVEINREEDLKRLYTPGVAEPCKAIANDLRLTTHYTAKSQTVAVISDGSAVLGLGNIGAYASLPVLESKAALLAHFAGVSVVPLALNTQDPDRLIEIIKSLEPSFGAIFLEDIAAPNCIEIEEKLQQSLSIPVYHDDQHGTAIVVLASLINALKIVNKNKSAVRIVLLGTGAAGSAIIRLLNAYGFTHIDAFNQDGYLFAENQPKDDAYVSWLRSICSINPEINNLEEAMHGSDVFIGVSKADLITGDMIRSMAQDAIVFPLANPVPEIAYDVALMSGARVLGTGSFSHPNQINNLLAFPGLIKAALDSKATQITTAMKITTAETIAARVSDEDLHRGQVVPSVFDTGLIEDIATQITKLVKADLL